MSLQITIPDEMLCYTQVMEAIVAVAINYSLYTGYSRNYHSTNLCPYNTPTRTELQHVSNLHAQSIIVTIYWCTAYTYSVTTTNVKPHAQRVNPELQWTNDPRFLSSSLTYLFNLISLLSQNKQAPIVIKCVQITLQALEINLISYYQGPHDFPH